MDDIITHCVDGINLVDSIVGAIECRRGIGDTIIHDACILEIKSVGALNGHKVLGAGTLVEDSEVADIDTAESVATKHRSTCTEDRVDNVNHRNSIARGIGISVTVDKDTALTAEETLACELVAGRILTPVGTCIHRSSKNEIFAKSKCI